MTGPEASVWPRTARTCPVTAPVGAPVGVPVRAVSQPHCAVRECGLATGPGRIVARLASTEVREPHFPTSKCGLVTALAAAERRGAGRRRCSPVGCAREREGVRRQRAVRLLRGRRGGRQVHPVAPAQRLARGVGPHRRAHLRARRHRGRQGAAPDRPQPGDRRALAPHRGPAVRRRQGRARRHGRAARRWPGARWSSPTATSTRRWPTRAPAATWSWPRWSTSTAGPPATCGRT